MIIVITLPYFFHGEAEQIVRLLRSHADKASHTGQCQYPQADLVHIRKPSATLEETERLILSIPQKWRDRLVLHDHHILATKYHLHGIHLNSRNPSPPAHFSLSVSRSCHSLEEVKAQKANCDYVSLSPIFDSISKQGYHSAFTKAQIEQAHRQGIIDSKVMALGGITFSKIEEIKEMGFGGAMILGDAWRNNKKQSTHMIIR